VRRAEVTRLLLTYGGVAFEDKIVDYEKDWPALKPSMPFGQVHRGLWYRECASLGVTWGFEAHFLLWGLPMFGDCIALPLMG
jgi:hypothetical protein